MAVLVGVEGGGVGSDLEHCEQAKRVEWDVDVVWRS